MRPSHDPAAAYLLTLAAVGAWVLSSSAMIFINKSIYTHGFGYPFLLTACGQLVSFAGGALLVASRLFPVVSPPTPAFFLSHVAPVVATTVTTLYTGNAAYLGLSVAFIQIVKGFTPGLTLSLAVLRGAERITIPLVAAITMTSAGTFASAMIEGAAPTFNAAAFLCMLTSCASEALRAVLVQNMHTARRGGFNIAETLIYISLPTALCLLALSALFEGHAAIAAATRLAEQHPLALLTAVSLSFLVNMTSFLAIKRTSSLTFKVIGCAKNVAVVAIGNLRGDSVTMMQGLAYAISLSGFFLYSVIRSQGMAARGPDGQMLEVIRRRG